MEVDVEKVRLDVTVEDVSLDVSVEEVSLDVAIGGDGVDLTVDGQWVRAGRDEINAFVNEEIKPDLTAQAAELEADFNQNASEKQSIVETLVSKAETAATQAETAQTAAAASLSATEARAAEALAAQNTAETAADSALESKTHASQSAITATTKASEAVASATQAAESAARVEEVVAEMDRLADVDLSNLSVTGQSKFDAKQDLLSGTQLAAVDSGITSSKVSTYDEYASELATKLNQAQITNCLLDNPRLVDFSLSNGVVTFQSGLTVIVPHGKSAPTMSVGDSLNGGTISDISWDGANLFYYVTYDETIIYNTTGSAATRAITIGPDKNFSQSSVHTTTMPNNGIWYDLNENFIKIVNSGTVIASTYSLPFCFATWGSNNLITSIDKIFQSIGYMGSIIWVGKGVKGLIPNGFNADGGLNNTMFERSTVLLGDFRNITFMPNAPIVIRAGRFIEYWNPVNTYYQNEKPPVSYWARWYKVNENKWYVTNDTGAWFCSPDFQCCVIGFVSGTQGGSNPIESFYIKTAFHSVDYNDFINANCFTPVGKNTIVRYVMPDYSSVISVSTPYTAPSNGLMMFTSVKQNVTCSISVNGTSIYAAATTSVWQLFDTSIFVSKGDVVSFANFDNVKFIKSKEN